MNDPDDGLLFLASVTKPDGSVLNRQTPNRREFLEWLDVHWSPDAGDELTVTLEAKGRAAVNTVVALRYGAERID